MIIHGRNCEKMNLHDKLYCLIQRWLSCFHDPNMTILRKKYMTNSCGDMTKAQIWQNLNFHPEQKPKLTLFFSAGSSKRSAHGIWPILGFTFYVALCWGVVYWCILPNPTSLSWYGFFSLSFATLRFIETRANRSKVHSFGLRMNSFTWSFQYEWSRKCPLNTFFFPVMADLAKTAESAWNVSKKWLSSRQVLTKPPTKKRDVALNILSKNKFSKVIISFQADFAVTQNRPFLYNDNNKLRVQLVNCFEPKKYLVHVQAQVMDCQTAYSDLIHFNFAGAFSQNGLFSTKNINTEH